MYEMLIVLYTHVRDITFGVHWRACWGEFTLKYMAMFFVFNCSSLPHVAEFSNHLHTDVRFQNWPMHYLWLESRGTKCVGLVRQETEIIFVRN